MAHASGAGLAQRERERGILQTMGRESQGQDFTHDGRPLGDSNSRTARGNARAVLGEESSTEGEVRSVVDGPSHAGRDGSLADANQLGAFEGRQQRGWEQCGPSRDPWSCHGWINGHDGKARRVEPSIRLLAHGLPGCVGRLRAYGNAIVPQVAAEFIEAYAEARGLMLTQFEAAA
jgi:DNA (cytosine-5)-methyltransferase 1